MADDDATARAIAVAKSAIGDAPTHRPEDGKRMGSIQLDRSRAEAAVRALAAAGLLAAPTAQPDGDAWRDAWVNGKRVAVDADGGLWDEDDHDSFRYRMERSYELSLGQIHGKHGLRWVTPASEIDAFEDHASPAAPTERCPRCDSPDPAKHPAVQFEGEVSICPDPWHSPAAPADDEAATEKAIYAGWNEFRYPRPAVDEPTDAFKRGVRAALAALREGKQQ